MASQLALDFSRFRLRAVEIDGTATHPRVKAFAAVDVDPPPPPAEGEAPAPWRWNEAAKELFGQARLAREPSAIALPSADCTFRDLELPFTGADQIDKVIKFEAESQLQLIDIDSVVVTYQLLDSDRRGGSRLLAAACGKDPIRRLLADLAPVNVDPHFADLHLSALYTALKFTGYFAPPPPPPAEAPPDFVSEGEMVLAIECDYDLTHVLVARGDTLLGARAMRLGLAAKAVATGTDGEEPAAEVAAEHEGDEDVLVVDDIGDEAPALGPGRRVAGEYFERLRREIQRTLFKLGPAADSIARVLLLGPVSQSESFRAHLEQKLRRPVEAATPFERVNHQLAEDALARANAEGTAALGVALRLAGYAGGSRVDFRREEVRYARRFDQVKFALSCLAIAAFVLVALTFIERLKQQRIKTDELRAGVYAVLGEYEQYAENRNLRDRVRQGTLPLIVAARTAKDDLEKKLAGLNAELGRSSGDRANTVARLPSGLDYLNAVVTSIDKAMPAIERIEITSLDLDVAHGRSSLKLRALLNDTQGVDALMKALRSCPAVKSVNQPTQEGAKDGRLMINNLELDLVDDYDPRSTTVPGAGR